ncbi:MAG: universal stress protein [Alphaproteobacteria bacterium]
MLNRIFVPLEDVETANDLLMQAFGFIKLLKAHADVTRVVAVERPQISSPLLARWPIIGGITRLPMLDPDSMPEIKDYIKRYEAEVEAARKAYRDIFDKACDKYQIKKRDVDNTSFLDEATASWIDSSPALDGDSIIIKQSLVSDLCLTSRPLEESDIWLSPVIHNILFDASKPLILLPTGDNIKPIEAMPKHVAIAWNGSNESSHAVSSAMPFIRAAETVTILTYETKKTDPSEADEIEKWLGFHGISTDKLVFDALEVTSVGASLLAEIEERKIDFMIAGAYGHSRMREFVLGGVTTHLLTRCPVPLFMAH